MRVNFRLIDKRAVGDRIVKRNHLIQMRLGCRKLADEDQISTKGIVTQNTCATCTARIFPIARLFIVSGRTSRRLTRPGSTRSKRDVIARGVFTSVPDLRRKLMRYIRQYNKAPKTIKWRYRDPTRRIALDSAVTVH